MHIKILGGHGGLSSGSTTTSFLINNSLLIDAGSVSQMLPIEDQVRIDHILISHSHLDHIKDLAFLCDNCFGMKNSPFQVHTHATVKKILKQHLFNDTIWPDFTVIPNKENPTIQIHPVEPEKSFIIGEFTVTPVKVQHPNDAMGFIVEDRQGAALFTVDTGPTERIWEVAENIKNLKAIFTEVSFPNKLEKVAQLSDHHTPLSLKAEIKKMPLNIPIILTHIKPNFREEIEREVAELGESRIQIFKNDGQEFQF